MALNLERRKISHRGQRGKKIAILQPRACGKGEAAKPLVFHFTFAAGSIRKILPMLQQSQKSDLDYILQQATQAATPQDELALLRTSLRAYMEGKSAPDAVAWAANALSKSITHDHR